MAEFSTPKVITPPNPSGFIEIYDPEDPDPEPLDLVDDTDCVIGRTYQSLVYEGRNHLLGRFYCRQSDVLLENDKGELFTPIRQPHKKLAPNGLDFAAAEHVQAGESYLAGAVRGVQEELRMDIDSDELTYLGRLTPWGTMTRYFSEVYLMHSNAIPDYNQDDYQGFLLLRPERLIEVLHQGSLAKKTLAPGLGLYLDYRAQQ